MSFGDAFLALSVLGQMWCPTNSARGFALFAGVGYGSAGHHSLHCLPTSTPVLALAGVKGGCCGDVRIWDKASGIGLNTQGSTELQRQDHPCK